MTETRGSTAPEAAGPAHAASSHSRTHTGGGHVDGLVQCHWHDVASHSTSQPSREQSGAPHTVSHAGQQSDSHMSDGQCTWQRGALQRVSASRQVVVHTGGKHTASQCAAHVGTSAPAQFHWHRGWHCARASAGSSSNTRSTRTARRDMMGASTMMGPWCGQWRNKRIYCC
jgi:uncharacterized protein YodC (DUF2158 family)